MNLHKFKITLIQKIIACNNFEVLKEIEKLTSDVAVIDSDIDSSPAATTPETETSLTAEQQMELNKRYQDFLEDKAEFENIDTFNKKIYEKYGF